MTKPVSRYLCIAALAICLQTGATAQAQKDDLTFFVVVKSSNYAQARDGALTLLNYHFFSEIFLKEGGRLTGTSLARKGSGGPAMTFVDRGHNHYVEGGHFDSLEEVDAAYPNGEYVFNMSTPSGDISELSLTLAGPGGKSQIPDPITITLLQDGKAIDPMTIDTQKDLTVTWSDFTVGAPDPKGIVDDLIFFVIADCHGERIVHTGLPFEGPYFTYEVKQHTVPAGTLVAGEPHSMFVEFPNQVDTVLIDGVPGFATYATATYIDTHTTGEATGPACPDVSPPMDTGQTDRSGR